MPKESLEEVAVSAVRGTPEEYLPSLIKIIRAYNDSVTLNPAPESFRRALRDVKAGEVYPLDTLWDGIDAE